jgi:hypothetical protein
MPVLICEESNYAGPIPEDEILPAKVTGVKQVIKPFKDDDGNDVVKIEFSFQVEDPGGAFDGQRLWGDTSTVFTTNPNCRLHAWAQELFGQELPAGFALDTDDLKGKTCRIVVAQKTYKDKNTQEDKVRNFVKDLFRARDGSPFGGVEEEPF